MPDRHWCDFCGDWSDHRHYDPDEPLGLHLAGVEYGPYGRLLAIEAAARELVDAADPEVLDDGTLDPYCTASNRMGWIAEAHGKLAGLLGPAADA